MPYCGPMSRRVALGGDKEAELLQHKTYFEEVMCFVKRVLLLKCSLLLV